MLVLSGDHVAQVSTCLQQRRIDPRLARRLNHLVEHRGHHARVHGNRRIRIRIKKDRVLRPRLAPELLSEPLQLALQRPTQALTCRAVRIPLQRHRPVRAGSPLHEPRIIGTINHQPGVLLTHSFLLGQTTLTRLHLLRTLLTPRTPLLTHAYPSTR